MPNVVGVQFQKAGKLEYYAPNDLKLDSEDSVSYTHLTLPTTLSTCRSRWSPYH